VTDPASLAGSEYFPVHDVELNIRRIRR